jgi:predicted GIY-YIG superfamily endonuclease
MYNNPMKNYYVYILYSKRNGTLHIGTTLDPDFRRDDHNANLGEQLANRTRTAYQPLRTDVN